MKNIKITLILCFILSAFGLSAQHSHNGHNHNSKSEVSNQETDINLTKKSFTVYGNCGMCEKTIESSLQGVDGLMSGDWDKETDIMVVEYDSNKISLLEIKRRIAAVGYDTDEVRATKEVYNDLPSCCQYDRPE